MGARMKESSKGKAKEVDEGEREPEVMVIDYWNGAARRAASGQDHE
jgi:hypothetical protein